MLHEFLKSVVVQSFSATDGGSNGPVVFTSTGDKFIFTAAAPVRLLKWGFMVANTAVAQTSSAMQFNLDQRVTAGSDTGRVNIDTLTTAASSSYALGTGAYRDPWTTSTQATTPASQQSSAGPEGETFYLYSGQAQMVLKAGQQWVIKCQVASDNTGQGKLFIEYELLPISKPSGYGTTDAGVVSLTENLTRLAS